MIVEVIDMDDSTTGLPQNSIGLWNAAHRPQDGRVIVKLYGMSNGVEEMVTQIEQRVQSGRIDLLRVWGHGYPGGQGVSGGHDGTAFQNDFAGMTVTNFSGIQHSLSRLTALFTPNAKVELRGCTVAQGAGSRLLTLLAQLWGVPVQGGAVTQHASSNWDPPVYEADPPNGALRCVPGSPLN